MADRSSKAAPSSQIRPGHTDVPSINPKASPRASGRQPDVEAFVHGILLGDRVVLSRAITLIESTRMDHQQQALEIIERCLPHAGQSIRIGITGVPGVGKSTFIEAFGRMLTTQGKRLAVLAIDPSSSRTHGSILGDKTRMPTLAADPNAYIRPSPTSGSLGGVARRTRETILLCEAAGFDTIFVETVGVGQSEVAVHSMVDVFLLLALAGAGDELQGIKRGIVEVADAVVITKCDGDNMEAGKKARGHLRNAINLFPASETGWRPPVLLSSAMTGLGLEKVWETVQKFLADNASTFGQRRREQARFWLHQTVEQQLRTQFYQHPAIRDALPALEKAVMAGTISTTAAAEQLMAAVK